MKISRSPDMIVDREDAWLVREQIRKLRRRQEEQADEIEREIRRLVRMLPPAR